MKRSDKGFTLIELIIVISIIGILAVVSSPFLIDLVRNARYREAARDVASVLRDARARAVATNLEHRVKFVAGADSPQTTSTYIIQQGNRAYESTNWPDIPETANTFPSEVDMRFNLACSEDTNPVYISFNPNGSSNPKYVCIIDGDSSISPLNNRKKYVAGVSHGATGRVQIRRWNITSGVFETPELP